jgi:hypothetical protein
MLGAELCTYLAGASIGLVAGTSVFSGPIPDSCSVLAVGMVELPGERPIRTFSPSLAADLVQRPGVQIVVRGVENGAAAARSKAKDVYNKLANLGPVQLSSVLYYDVQPEGGIQGPYFDDSTNRPRFLMNFRIHKDPS